MQTHVIRPNLMLKSLLIIVSMLFTFSCAQTKENGHSSPDETAVLPGYIFTPTTNITSQVEQTLTAAKTENKLALLVLGAQWCHDSKGLAKKFSAPQMQKILNDNYHVLFIDIGYLEKGFDVVNQFGLPVYYGTPTVMVIEPNSTEILNKASLQKWLNADKVSLNEYVEYFDSFTSNNKVVAKVSQPMQTYLAQINKFEQLQALRIKEAYGVLGPLLKQYMDSNDKKASDGFSDKWQQVGDLRYRIQDDIQVLITQAKSNLAAGSSAPLTLPIYPAFTWE